MRTPCPLETAVTAALQAAALRLRLCPPASFLRVSFRHLLRAHWARCFLGNCPTFPNLPHCLGAS